MYSIQPIQPANPQPVKMERLFSYYLKLKDRRIERGRKGQFPLRKYLLLKEVFEGVVSSPFKKLPPHGRMVQVFEKSQKPPKDVKPFKKGVKPPCKKVKKDEPKYQTAVETLCEQAIRGPVRQEYVGKLLSSFKRLCEKSAKVKEKEPPQGRRQGQE